VRSEKEREREATHCSSRKLGRISVMNSGHRRKKSWYRTTTSKNWRLTAACGKLTTFARHARSMSSPSCDSGNCV